MSFLEKLARVNRTAVFLVTLVVFLAALFLGKFGGFLLVIIAGVLAALMAQTWPVTDSKSRILRVTVLVLLVITGLAKIFK